MSEAAEPDPEFPADAAPNPLIGTSKPRLLGILGPGLITGASDDDPSGIATYSQAGAQTGFALLWLMPFTYPLMAVTQEISARLGRTTGHGLAGYDIKVFRGSMEAIEALEAAERIQLLITRVSFPEGTPNGVSLARMAKVKKRGSASCSPHATKTASIPKGSGNFCRCR